MFTISLEDSGYETLPEESLLEISLEVQETTEELNANYAKYEALDVVTFSLESINTDTPQAAHEQLRSTLALIGQEQLTDVVIANEGLGDLAKKAWEKLKAIVKKIIEGVKKVVKKIIDWIKKMLGISDCCIGDDNDSSGTTTTTDDVSETLKSMADEAEEKKEKINEIVKVEVLDAELVEDEDQTQNGALPNLMTPKITSKDIFNFLSRRIDAIPGNMLINKLATALHFKLLTGSRPNDTAAYKALIAAEKGEFNEKNSIAFLEDLINKQVKNNYPILLGSVNNVPSGAVDISVKDKGGKTTVELYLDLKRFSLKFIKPEDLVKKVTESNTLIPEDVSQEEHDVIVAGLISAAADKSYETPSLPVLKTDKEVDKINESNISKEVVLETIKQLEAEIYSDTEDSKRLEKELERLLADKAKLEESLDKNATIELEAKDGTIKKIYKAKCKKGGYCSDGETKRRYTMLIGIKADIDSKQITYKNLVKSIENKQKSLNDLRKPLSK